MHRRDNILATLLLLACLGVLGTSCQNRRQQVVNPLYSGHYYPKSVQFVLDSKKGTTVPMKIDHMRKRIYNATPLPYGTKLDSAYMDVVMSNQLNTILRNVTAQTSKAFSSSDTGKIEVKGGKLELVIERKDMPTLTYDIRIMSYGYDPNKLTWSKKDGVIPAGVEQSKLVPLQDKYYYLTRDAQGVGALYVADLAAGTFTAQAAEVPGGLLPTTLYLDHKGTAWALDDTGHLYSSINLLQWTDHTPEGVRLTQILNDKELNPNRPTDLSAIGTPADGAGRYYIYTGEVDRMAQHREIPTGFPVRDAYVYNYVISGTQHSNILGGIKADGQPAELSFFTSDGVRWGKTPYQYSSSNVPDTGGLYLRRREGSQIMLVGGRYKEGMSNKIKVSEDRGITWKVLEASQLPGDSFTPRAHIAGTVILDSKGIEHIYLLGGVRPDGTPTQEVWHGYLDTTGGILNSYQD